MESTKTEKFVNAVLNKKNIKAQNILERIFKEKIIKKIAKTLKN